MSTEAIDAVPISRRPRNDARHVSKTELLLKLQELVRELTEMNVLAEMRLIQLTESVENMKMELRDINEQVQFQVLRFTYFPPPGPFGGGDSFGEL